MKISTASKSISTPTPEPEEFATEAAALAYCSGIGFGTDERAPVERYPLRTSEECDLPFIEVLKNS